MRMYFMLFLLALCGAGVGFMVSSISNNINQNSIIATAIIMPILAFTGLVVNLETMPKWWGWIQYFSPSRFAFNGICIDQWDKPPFKEVYTDILGFGTTLTYWDCAASMIALAIFFRVCGLVALSKKIKKF